MAKISVFFLWGDMTAVVLEERVKASIDHDGICLGESIRKVDLKAYVREVPQQYELVDEASSCKTLTWPLDVSAHKFICAMGCGKAGTDSLRCESSRPSF